MNISKDDIKKLKKKDFLSLKKILHKEKKHEKDNVAKSVNCEKNCSNLEDCIDCEHCHSSQKLVNCKHVIKSVNCKNSEHLWYCANVFDSKDMNGCTSCIGCHGLMDKSLMVLNVQFEEAEYYKYRDSIYKDEPEAKITP